MSVLPLTNPFLAPSAPVAAARPEVDLGNLEDSLARTLEVRVLWGDQVLHVAHLSEGGLSLGEAGDVLVPEAVLGSRHFEVVRFEGGQATLHAPVGARLSGLVTPLAAEQSVQVDDHAGFSLGDFSVEVSLQRAGKRPVAPLLAGLGEGASRQVGLSMVLHAALIASFAFFMPSLGADDAESMSREQILQMRAYLDAAADKEKEALDEKMDDAQNDPSGGTGQRAVGEEGKMGNANAQVADARWAKKGPADNPDPALAQSREAMLHEASTLGMISLLSSAAVVDPNAPTHPWGREDALGKDPLSADGNMWGSVIGESFGGGGLGLSGGGLGGGGTGKGVGLGEIGFGHTMGTCADGGPCLGMGPGGSGRGTGRLRPDHKVRDISMKQGITQVNGHIPAEVIQRIVRANFGRFRNCYESGLRTNPALTGRVATRFVIDRTGAVSMAQDGGSDMPDRSVVSCVVRSFQNLSFPAPEGGVVTVSYPINFSPGE